MRLSERFALRILWRLCLTYWWAQSPEVRSAPLILRDILQCVWESDVCAVTASSRSPGTGTVRTPPSAGRRSQSKKTGKPGVGAHRASRMPTGFAASGDFSHSLGQVSCFVRIQSRVFTEVDKHEMHFPEKFPKWGKVHGSEAPVGNEGRLRTSVFLYKKDK